MQAIAEEAYRRRPPALIDHHDLLDEVAERLLDGESIEREEIVEIMRAPGKRGGVPQAPAEHDPAGRAEVMASKPPQPSE